MGHLIELLNRWSPWLVIIIIIITPAVSWKLGRAGFTQPLTSLSVGPHTGRQWADTDSTLSSYFVTSVWEKLPSSGGSIRQDIHSSFNPPHPDLDSLNPLIILVYREVVSHLGDLYPIGVMYSGRTWPLHSCRGGFWPPTSPWTRMWGHISCTCPHDMKA